MKAGGLHDSRPSHICWRSHSRVATVASAQPAQFPQELRDAQAAMQAQKFPEAIAAYETFLKVADPKDARPTGRHRGGALRRRAVRTGAAVRPRSGKAPRRPETAARVSGASARRGDGSSGPYPQQAGPSPTKRSSGSPRRPTTRSRTIQRSKPNRTSPTFARMRGGRASAMR